MATQIPISGLSDAAGGYILPEDQGALLTEGLLQEVGAIALAGDTRRTTRRKETFSIWRGEPTAEFVPEAGTKPVTGGEFGPGTITVQKVASIVIFTDEMLDDVQGGDLNVLVDSGVRSAIADTIDADAIDGSNFDQHLSDTGTSVTMGAGADALASAVSAAMGTLEANGYTQFGVILGPDLARHLRDARVVPGGGTAGTITGTEGLYQSLSDPLYGLPRFSSTNLDTIAGGGTIGYVVSRPNLHVRLRQDVTVKPSNEGVVGGTSLYQQDLTALRYVTRLAFGIHDVDRAVVKITK